MRTTWTKKMKRDILVDLGLTAMVLGFLAFGDFTGMALVLRVAYMFALLGGIALLHLPMNPGLLARVRDRVLYAHTMLLASLLMPVNWTLSWDLVRDPGTGQIGFAIIFVCTLLVMIIEGGENCDDVEVGAEGI